ncbi:hypothetical protein G3O08_00340 [Cryomorpha ignava]|uniref:Tetratricopeptide repeat protein n=1 Tax=Cryomorpha ignava TaxID=101383 RepID=A0A7K3WLN8_9FLAO|nr:CDC27 family protein [Cryomorpha ignava]NEN21951.1 hypothetical protein [Cryomorpha ignava]
MDKEAINIERFINGGMDAGERTGFEARMASDPFLAEAVDGFLQDPAALYDLPICSAVKINWWWSIVGAVAVATVFLTIPNRISEIPGSSFSRVRTVNIDLEKVELQSQEQTTPVWNIELDNTIKKSGVTPVWDENHSPNLLTADFVDSKSAKPILKIEYPKLKVDEMILYVLDLKVVKSKLIEVNKPEIDLSELTDFTPANFSTTIAYKRSKQYEGIFPEPKTETYMDKLESGLRYFKAEDYVKALNVLSNLLIENNQDPNAQFYSALSHYHLGDYQMAEAGFEQMEKLATLSFAPESEWYRALSLQKLGRTDEARDLLLEIADDGGHYAERAMVLLEKE